MPNQRSVVLRVDGFNQASPGPSANQGQMLGMSGRGGPIAPEGSTNMGTPMMSENGAMVMYQNKKLVFQSSFDIKRILYLKYPTITITEISS